MRLLLPEVSLPDKKRKSMDRQVFMTDEVRKQLISKNALIKGGIFTEVSYRSQKSRRRLEEIVLNQGRWVLLDSLTDVTRRKVRAAFATLISGYEQQFANFSSDFFTS